MYEDKMRKLRQELKNLQELQRQSQDEASSYEDRLSEMKSEVSSSMDRNRLNLKEMAQKEEELVVVKVELSSVQEKLRNKVEEVRKLSFLSLLSPRHKNAKKKFKFARVSVIF